MVQVHKFETWRLNIQISSIRHDQDKLKQVWAPSIREGMNIYEQELEIITFETVVEAATRFLQMTCTAT